VRVTDKQEDWKEMAKMIDGGDLIVPGAEMDVDRMPPILAGQSTKTMERRVERFYFSVGAIFEAWVRKRPSPHTQRAYRQDVMAFIEFLKFDWPKESTELLAVSVGDVMEWRDQLEKDGMAPKTMNRRISSVSSFYKYLQAIAAEMRLPIVVPNPAHAQFIGRSSRDPVDETKALTATKARQLMGLPQGDDVIAFRDRALIRFMLYSGVRLGTAVRVRVQDFHLEAEHEATVRINEKGEKRRTIGIHFAAAEAIAAYIKKANLESGPLFRPRSGPRSHTLKNTHMSETSMYILLLKYLSALPGSMRSDESGRRVCLYSPHSLRATTATLLLDANVDIRKVQELLGHRHVTTTQIYDKRRRTTKESASHDVPI
jgi:site-specific recombinase XerC